MVRLGRRRRTVGEDNDDDDDVCGYGPGALAYVHYTEVRKMRCSGAYVMPRVGAQDVKALERMLDAEERG